MEADAAAAVTTTVTTTEKNIEVKSTPASESKSVPLFFRRRNLKSATERKEVEPEPTKSEALFISDVEEEIFEAVSTTSKPTSLKTRPAMKMGGLFTKSKKVEAVDETENKKMATAESTTETSTTTEQEEVSSPEEDSTTASTTTPAPRKLTRFERIRLARKNRGKRSPQFSLNRLFRARNQSSTTTTTAKPSASGPGQSRRPSNRKTSGFQPGRSQTAAKRRPSNTNTSSSKPKGREQTESRVEEPSNQILRFRFNMPFNFDRNKFTSNNMDVNEDVSTTRPKPVSTTARTTVSSTSRPVASTDETTINKPVESRRFEGFSRFSF